MSVTSDEIRVTEKMLTTYFKDIKVLNIWKASIRSRHEHKTRLEERIESGALFQFTDNIKSPSLSIAAPTNRQPPKGIDACIDKASEIYDNLIIELRTTEFDIITTEEGIERLEQRTLLISEIINTLSKESRRILELKLDENKTFEYISDMTNKSKSAVHEFYKKTVCDICKWLKYMDALDITKK